MDNLEAIELLISSPSGHIVALDRLSVFRLDSANEAGEYAVNIEDHNGNEIEERYFRTAMQAAIFFETQRKWLKIGFEFERRQRGS